jgi:chorismate mutase
MSIKIKRLRKKIDKADRAFLRALKERLMIAEKIGKIKIAEGMPLFQKARWREMIEGRLALASSMGLERKFAKKLFEEIHKEALRIQRALRQSKKTEKRK